MFFANEVESLQNVYTPFPLMTHIVIAVVAAIVFFIQFYRKGGVYYLFMGAAVAATLITQIPNFSSKKSLIFALDILEIVLCVLIIVFYVINRIKSSKNKADKKTLDGQAQDNIVDSEDSEIEKEEEPEEPVIEENNQDVTTDADNTESDSEISIAFSELEKIAQNSIESVQKDLKAQRENAEKEKNDNPVENAFDNNSDLDIYL